MYTDQFFFYWIYCTVKQGRLAEKVASYDSVIFKIVELFNTPYTTTNDGSEMSTYFWTYNVCVRKKKKERERENMIFILISKPLPSPLFSVVCAIISRIYIRCCMFQFLINKTAEHTPF